MFRDAAMEGMSRWVGRIWRLAEDLQEKGKESSMAVRSALHKLIQKVSDDLEKRRYNTAIASMMEFTNFVADEGGAINTADFMTFLVLVAPFAPHVTEELYQRLQGKKQESFEARDSVHRQSWPVSDETVIHEESVAFVIQINGKLRDTLTVSAAQSKNQKDMESMARSSERIKNYIGGKKISKVIFVPGKLLNFVVPS